MVDIFKDNVCNLCRWSVIRQVWISSYKPLLLSAPSLTTLEVDEFDVIVPSVASPSAWTFNLPLGPL